MTTPVKTTAAATHLERLSWLARSSIAPPLAVALACIFIVVNEVGYQTISTIAVDRDQAMQSRVAVERLRATVIAA